MKLKTLVNKMLKAQPEAADLEVGDVCAVIFLDSNDNVFAIKSNTSEREFSIMCAHMHSKILAEMEGNA